MKRFQLIATALLLPLLGHGQAFVDDIYYSPGDENAQAETPKAEPANYKNGAKEIVFIDSNSGEELYLDTDTIFLDNGPAEDETAEADAQLRAVKPPRKNPCPTANTPPASSGSTARHHHHHGCRLRGRGL